MVHPVPAIECMLGRVVGQENSTREIMARHDESFVEGDELCCTPYIVWGFRLSLSLSTIKRDLLSVESQGSTKANIFPFLTPSTPHHSATTADILMQAVVPPFDETKRKQ